MIPTNPDAAAGLAIIVLAAGFSTRLGRPKALVRVRGTSLLRRTLKLASRLRAGRIIVVVPRNAARYRREARGIDAQFVINRERAQGLSSSVRRGIAAARFTRAALLMPVDLARLNLRDLRRLVAHWLPLARRCVARRVGQGGAAPLILPRRLYPEARKTSGDAGLRQLVRQLPAAGVVLIDLPSAGFDVDTADDLKTARRGRR
jgi:CTP:molybdopterin cytidylyltransferase MocA